MLKVWVLKTEGSKTEQWQMWIKALELWKLPYEIVEESALERLDRTDVGLILIAGADVLGEPGFQRLDSYIHQGGRILVSGNLPDRLAGFFGNIAVRKTVREQTHRCAIITDERGIGGWKQGDVLFFTNTYLTSGSDYMIEETAGFKGDIIAASQWMSLVDEETGEWGDWKDDPSPTLVSADIGQGKIWYTPLVLGAMHWVTQPRIPTFTLFPYEVKNFALLIFMGSLFERLIGSEAGSSRTLWPAGAKTVVCITGDVHDYVGLGLGDREDREYRDMIDHMNILQQYGLEGRATYYISGAVVERHPEEMLQGFHRGYEMCPHTYKDTCYCSAGFDYKAQKEDVERCIRAFREIAPQFDDYAKGFRTHGYNSGHETRAALEQLGYDYIADMQAWEAARYSHPGAPDGLITYMALPQRAVGPRGRPLKLLEIPDSIVNDHFVYRIYGLSPEEALQFYKAEFDKVHRIGGLFQVNFHPYVSLKEAPGREQTFREVIQYMVSHDDVAFLRMDELCHYWVDHFND